MITVYLKPTNYCNVGCAHCYLPESVRANKEKMDENTLHKVMQFLKEMQLKGKHDNVFFLWHGGEPLILSPDYFDMAGKIIDQYFPGEQKIEAVQTSLIPYRRDHSRIVNERWNGQIGSSMDFHARQFHGSTKEYQDIWMQKVNMAREDNIIVLPGITPNKKDCYNAKYIFDWFNDREFWFWNIDRYSNVGGELPDFSTNREHAQFLIDLFDLCVEQYEKTGYSTYIKPIAAGIGGVLFDQPGDRWGGTCQSDFIVINPDGRLNNCPDKDSFEPSYGNIFSGYESFAMAPLRKKWIRIQQAGHRIDECSTCENASFCKSGCPITGNACTINEVVDECSGFKSFLTHVRNFASKSQDNHNFLVAYMQHELMPKMNMSKVISDISISN
jgi:radical SAM protein with 4Fe4S-binding SPASM domain